MRGLSLPLSYYCHFPSPGFQESAHQALGQHHNEDSSEAAPNRCGYFSGFMRLCEKRLDLITCVYREFDRNGKKLLVSSCYCPADKKICICLAIKS